MTEFRFGLAGAEVPPNEPKTEVLPTEREIRELEEADLSTNLLKPEAFAENRAEGEIKDIASNGNYTFVVKKIKGIPRIKVYGNVGLVDVPERIPIDTYSYGSIMDAIKSAATTLSGSYIGFNPSRGSYVGPFIRVRYPDMTKGTEIKIIKDIVDKCRDRLDSDLEKNITDIDSIINQFEKNADDSCIDPEILPRVSAKSVGEKFIVLSGEKIIIYKVGREGTNLLPSEWERQIYKSKKDYQSASKRQSDLPDEYLAYDDKSRTISNAGIVATFSGSEPEILTFVDKDTRINYFRAGARDFDLDPADGQTVAFIKSEDRNVISSVDATQTKNKQWKLEDREVKAIDGKILEMKFDPHGNFIVVIYETETTADKPAKRKLAILEKDTWEKVKEYDSVNGHLEIDPQGTVYFEDSNHQLRAISTNFTSYPVGGLEGVRKKRGEKLANLQEKIGNLSIEDLKAARKQGKVKSAVVTEDMIREQLAGKVGELLDPEIEHADDLEKISEVRDKIEVLKNNVDFVNFPEVFLVVENEISKKENNIKVISLEGIIGSVEENVKSIETPDQALGLEGKLEEIDKIRKGITINDIEKRREINDRIQQLKDKSAEFIGKLQGQIEKLVSESLQKVKDLISEATTFDELNDVRNSQEAQDFTEIVGQLKDNDKRKGFRQQYKETIEAQRSVISGQQKIEDESARVKTAELLEDLGEMLEEISNRINDEVSDGKELDAWLKRNPLLTRFTSQTLALPDNLRKDMDGQLNAMIWQKRGDLEYRKTFKAPKNGGECHFGKETFPVYQEVQMVWRPRIIPLADGSAYGSLVFEDNSGRVYRPEIGNIPIDSGDQTTKQVTEMFRAKAEDYFKSLKRDVPHFNENWVLSDFYKDKLEEMAKLFKIQMEQQRGIYILEGEAGTGKNVLLDMFAHFTNREVFMFSCNMQSEKEDLTYAFRFDPQKGTYSVDSKVIESLKTPGAILIFDELNSLPKGVAKMLNPLLDYRRTLFSPEDKSKTVKAHPTVLIAGTQNPQHYLGVSPLSQEVKSRARITRVGYPPETIKEKGVSKYAPDEALVYAKYIESLKGLRINEFQKLWDYAVNGDKENGGDKFSDKNREKDLKKIKEVIKIANLIRSAYEGFRTGKSNDVIEFVFSLREGIDISCQLDSMSAKAATKDVVLPKISDPAERDKIETIIDNA